MSNYHWVCFSCRESVRRPGSSENVRCPSCASPCQNIGYKTPVPPKAKLKLWQALEASYIEARRNYVARTKLSSVRRVHELEKELARIPSLPENAGRDALVKTLSRQLEFAKSAT